MANSWAHGRPLFQAASSIVLSPQAVAEICWSAQSSATPLSFCAGSCSPFCKPDRSSLADGWQPVSVPDGLASFLIAVHRATSSVLYICVPVSGPSAVGAPSCLARERKPCVSCASSPGEPCEHEGGVAGRAGVRADTSILCCRAFKTVHYVYTLLSQGAPKGYVGANVYVLPVQASGEWRLTFRTAVLAHLRTLQLSEPDSPPTQTGEGDTPQADARAPGELSRFFNVADPHFSLTDAQFARCASTVFFGPGMSVDLARESLSVTLQNTASSFSTCGPGTKELPECTAAHIPVTSSAAVTVAPSSASPETEECRSSCVFSESACTHHCSTSPPKSSSEEASADDEARDSQQDFSPGTAGCASCRGPFVDAANLPEERGRCVETGEDLHFSNSCSARGSHGEALLCCGALPASLRGLSHIVVAGAFDRLHAGHKMLITAAALLTQSTLTIAVTAGDLISRKVTDPETCCAAGVEPFCARSSAACEFAALVLHAAGRACVMHNYTEEVLSEEFEGSWVSADASAVLQAWQSACREGGKYWPVSEVQKDGWDMACFSTTWSQAVNGPQWVALKSDSRQAVEIRLCRLLDPIGPAGDLNFDALVVSSESLAGGRLVNDERKKRNHPPVLLIKVEPIPALWRESFGDPAMGTALPALSVSRTPAAKVESHAMVTQHPEVCSAIKLSSTELRLGQALTLLHQADVRSLGGTFDEAIATVVHAERPVRNFLWSQLCQAYSVAWRRFFTLGRLTRLLSRARSLAVERLHLAPDERACVEVALWFAYAVHTPPAPSAAGLQRCRGETGRSTSVSGGWQGSAFDDQCIAVLIRSLFRDTDISRKFLRHICKEDTLGRRVRDGACSDSRLDTQAIGTTAREPHELCRCILECVKSARLACPFLAHPSASVGCNGSKQSSSYGSFADQCCKAARFVEFLDFAVPEASYSAEYVPKLRQEYYLASDAEFHAARQMRLKQWLRENDSSVLTSAGLLPSEVRLLRTNLETELQPCEAGAGRG